MAKLRAGFLDGPGSSCAGRCGLMIRALVGDTSNSVRGCGRRYRWNAILLMPRGLAEPMQGIKGQ